MVFTRDQLRRSSRIASQQKETHYFGKDYPRRSQRIAHRAPLNYNETALMGGFFKTVEAEADKKFAVYGTAKTPKIVTFKTGNTVTFKSSSHSEPQRRSSRLAQRARDGLNINFALYRDFVEADGWTSHKKDPTYKETAADLAQETFDLAEEDNVVILQEEAALAPRRRSARIAAKYGASI